MNHEKLECYQLLVSVAEEVARKVAKWPRGYGFLSDQLQRAMGSAVLNLAEGNGERRSKAERRRFFDIAFGSDDEARACLDLARAFRLESARDVDRLKSLLLLAAVKIRALP